MIAPSCHIYVVFNYISVGVIVGDHKWSRQYLRDMTSGHKIGEILVSDEERSSLKNGLDLAVLVCRQMAQKDDDPSRILMQTHFQPSNPAMPARAKTKPGFGHCVKYIITLIRPELSPTGAAASPRLQHRIRSYSALTRRISTFCNPGTRQTLMGPYPPVGEPLDPGGPRNRRWA